MQPSTIQTSTNLDPNHSGLNGYFYSGLEERQHKCPSVPGWSVPNQMGFIEANREAKVNVLWELRNSMMQAQTEAVLNNPKKRYCTFRVSPESANDAEAACKSESIPSDAPLSYLKWFGGNYAWSIPTPEICTYLSSLTGQEQRPVVEIGAGLGYWARVMRDRGVTWYAYDKYVEGYSKEKRLWTTVVEGGPEKLHAHDSPDTILFIGYPPQRGMLGYGMDVECIRNFKGRDIIYVGEELSENEKEINSTGSIAFAEALRESGFKQIGSLPCAQAPHKFDKMFHYRRKNEYSLEEKAPIEAFLQSLGIHRSLGDLGIRTLDLENVELQLPDLVFTKSLDMRRDSKLVQTYLMKGFLQQGPLNPKFEVLFFMLKYGSYKDAFKVLLAESTELKLLQNAYMKRSGLVAHVKLMQAISSVVSILCSLPAQPAPEDIRNRWKKAQEIMRSISEQDSSTVYYDWTYNKVVMEFCFDNFTHLEGCIGKPQNKGY